ncbi:MAG: hypothetical protein ACLFTG_11080 [Alphaproteobacteria bacterium]
MAAAFRAAAYDGANLRRRRARRQPGEFGRPNFSRPPRRVGRGSDVRYGRDFRDRVRAAGFALEELTCSGEEVVDYGLTRGERIFVCRKP